jgi:hypothetical protein
MKTLFGRLAAVLLLASGSTGAAFAREGLAARAADDGVVDAATQCQVYVAGVATSPAPVSLRYRWLDGSRELAPWREVRADRTAPLDLCGLGLGAHALTLEVTDGQRTASDTMTATVVATPALVASSEN